VTGESGTAHSDNARILYFFYDGLAVKFGSVAKPHKGSRAVDALFPFIAFYVHIDCHAACSAGIKGNIYLGDLAADAAVYGGTDESSGFSQQGADLYLIAFFHNGLGRGSDMLEHAEYCLFGQSRLAYGTCSRQFVLCGMYTAYLKCFHILSYSALEGSTSWVGVLGVFGALGAAGSSVLGLRGGKLKPWMAPLGQASSHLRHILHFSASM